MVGGARYDRLPSSACGGNGQRRATLRVGASLIAVDTTESRGLAQAAARAAAGKKASDIRILDIGNLLGITDFFVLASASNERQLATVVEEVEVRLKQSGRAPRRREGTRDTGWMLLDYGDVVLHAFTAEQRSHYGLERLWGDAPAVDFDERGVEVTAGDAVGD